MGAPIKIKAQSVDVYMEVCDPDTHNLFEERARVTLHSQGNERIYFSFAGEKGVFAGVQFRLEEEDMLRGVLSPPMADNMGISFNKDEMKVMWGRRAATKTQRVETNTPVIVSDEDGYEDRAVPSLRNVDEKEKVYWIAAASYALLCVEQMVRDDIDVPGLNV